MDTVFFEDDELIHETRRFVTLRERIKTLMMKLPPPSGGYRQSAPQRSHVCSSISSVRQPQNTSILVGEYWIPATRHTTATQENSTLAWATWGIMTSPPAWVLLAAWAAWRVSSSGLATRRPQGHSSAAEYATLEASMTAAEAIGRPSYITPAERWAAKNIGPGLSEPPTAAELWGDAQVRMCHQT